MTKISYFGKQNSTLGSVVPLAMFHEKKIPSKIIFDDVIKIPNFDCRCNSTEKSLLGCTGQLDLKLAFLFLGQTKVKNQEDFLLVEVGQRNFVALLMIFMKS